MPKKSDGKDYPMMTLPSGEKAQIWFPTNISDLDERANEVLEGGKDLEKTDHPSFNDKEYLERKKQFIDIATSYKYGQPIPHVKYNPDEVNTWNTVFEKLTKLYPTHACKEHNSVFSLSKKKCGYRKDNIPQLEEVSNFIKAQTGFQLRPVAGLLSSRDFLAGLAFCIFHCTQYVRHPKDSEYNPEPDVCHELLGHVPLLCDPTFADFCQEFGLISLGASDEDIEKLAALYWFTIEFGICKENGENKAYGAGLLSSYGELQKCLTEKPDKPFIPEDAAMQDYKITDQQKVYFVAENFDDARKKMMEWTLRAIKKPFTLHYDKRTETVKIDEPGDSTGNLRKLQYKVKELEGELQKKDNEVTILKTRSLNKDREVDLLKYTINQQKKQPDVVKYYSQVFYKFNQHQKEWEIVFVTVQDDLKYKQLVMKMYSDYLKDVYQILELDENATHLQLMKDRSPIYPWEMNELTTAEIDINEINKFLPEPSRVPHCHFKFCWLSEIYPPKLLKMKFHLIGTKGPNNFFYIFLPRDNIPDAVSILDEMVFTFNENTETTFELPEYDLCINVPEGSVTQKTEMYIRPVLTGDFKLPPGCHQVSGIYQIECSEKLEKDISLRMGHYAVVDSQEEYANFSFYSASASTGPPYVFEKVESDSFVVDNMYASITLHHFCFFSYFWFGEKKLRYCSQMFYKIFNNGLCHIEMLFVVTENKHTLTKFVKESYKERGYDEYADQMIKFKKGETSLKVKPENEELDTWRMTAKQNPEIKKDEIDDFKPNVSGSIPHCCYSFGWPSNSSPTPLSMKFNLIGADDSNSYFNVDLHVTGSSQYSVSHGSLTADTNSQTSSSSSQDTSLYNIFKARMSKMLDVVSDPDTDRLANDLSLADLIPYSVKDHVITKNLDRYKKASILLNEIERSLRISNKPEDLKTFCEILKKLDNPSLTRIADEILKKLKNKITHPLSPSIHPPTKRLRVDEEQEEEEEEEEKEAEEKIEEEREVMRKRKRTKKSKENQVKRRK